MKRIPPLALLVMPYLVLALIMDQGLSAACLGLVMAIFGGVAALNLVWALLAVRLGFSARQLVFWNLLLKLCHIPFYLLVFAMGVLLNVMIIPLLPILAAMDYLLLLSSSLYGVRGLRLAQKQGLLSPPAAWVCIALQFFFCLDVASALYSWLRLRKKAK